MSCTCACHELEENHNPNDCYCMKDPDDSYEKYCEEQADLEMKQLIESKNKKSKVTLLQPVWLPRPTRKYHGCFPLGFEKYIPELLRTDDYYHFFSGPSKCGFTIDINESVNPNLVANVENLDILSEQKGGVIADPPYNIDFAEKLYNCKYPQWSKWTKEAVRLTKKGGYIAIMQNYVVPCPKGCKFVEILPIITRIKQFPKIVTVFQKELS